MIWLRSWSAVGALHLSPVVRNPRLTCQLAIKPSGRPAIRHGIYANAPNSHFIHFLITFSVSYVKYFKYGDDTFSLIIQKGKIVVALVCWTIVGIGFCFPSSPVPAKPSAFLSQYVVWMAGYAHMFMLKYILSPVTALRWLKQSIVILIEFEFD